MLMQPALHHDPAFPKLADALDPMRAGYAFETMLAGAGFPVSKLRCTIERARLKLGRKALIGYRLTGEDTNGRAFDQRVMLILWPQGDAGQLPEMGAALTEPAFGPARANIEPLQGEAWFFPNDRKVHHIAALLTETPKGVADEMASREIIHYVPEQGCTVRLKMPSGQVYYGKCRTDDRGAVAARVAAAAAGQGHPALRLALGLDYEPDRHIFWQAHVTGRPLDAADACARAGYWAESASRALAALHVLAQPADLKQLTIQSITQTLASRVKRNIAAMPALAAEIAQVGEMLTASQPTDSNKLVLSHCDLHPANLLWDGSSFAMIDLDTAALAPAALDHGSLVASLAHAAIEAQARDNTVDAMITAFRSAAHDEIDDARTFNWFVAASLIGERLYRCGTRMKSPALRTRMRLIETARRLLEAKGGAHG
jgi:thiamine kinase-like enzyme